MENKVSVCIIKTDPENRFLEKTLQSLEENQEFIDEIIFTGFENELPETDLEIKTLDLDSENRAFLRNQCIDNASNELILWISNSTELEDTTIEEFLETLEENDNADFIYGNEVLTTLENDEIVRNFHDIYGREADLLQSLAIENELPEFGVLSKKEVFQKYGKFDENFDEFEFYKYVLDNIKDLKMKLSDLSFTTTYETTRFIDTSYNSKALRDTVKKYNWKTDLFPSLNWNSNENLALTTAYSLIGQQLKKYHDYYNASEYFRKALMTFHNKHSLEQLVESYYFMGMFDEALKLVTEDQGFSKEEIQEIKQKISQTKSLVENIEKAIEEGNANEILLSAFDISQVYQGAPIYNILGVINFMQGKTEDAFRFFYKAVIINPLDDDIVKNLADVSKMLGKEDKVIKLIGRIFDQELTSV